MTVRGRAVARRAEAEAEARAMPVFGGGGWYGTWGDPSVIPPNVGYNTSAAGVVVNERAVVSLMSVFSCIRVLGDAVAHLETHYYRGRGDEEREIDPPAFAENPYSDIDVEDGDFRLVASFGLGGHAYFHVIDRDPRGNPALVELLNPGIVKTVLVDGRKVYRLGVVGRELNAFDVVECPWVALPGATVGLNPIEVGSMGLGIAIAAEEYAGRWYAQGAHPTGILSVNKPLGPKEAEELKDELMIKHGGLAQSHVPIVLDSDAKWQSIGLSPEASQLLSTRQFSREEIAGFYGVPPHLIGDTSDRGGPWGKGLQETIISFALFCLSGYTRRHARLWTRMLPRGVHARKNVSDIFKTNDQMLSQFLSALRSASVATPNELRKMVRLGRTEEPGADSIFAPLNSAQSDWMQPAGPAGEGAPESGESGESGGPDTGDEGAGASIIGVPVSE